MATFTKRVSHTNDDGHKWPTAPGSWETGNVEVGKTILGDAVNSAVRFRDVTIPAGATITSAKLTVRTWFDQTRDLVSKISGIDEDNTADFSSDPMGRAETTAKVDWDKSTTFTGETDYDSADISSVVQEIIDRAGWASGNSMGFFIKDDGSSPNDGQNLFYDYENSGGSTKAVLLTVEYTTTGSPSVSPSVSPSQSPSSSISPSVSPSPSASVSSSLSRSPSPSPEDRTMVIEIAKDGIDILKTNDPQDLKFSSRFGTLKYFVKSQQILTIDGSVGDWAGKKIYTHNLGYYPFVEVFVRVYIGSPSGNYEYVPFFGSGASVAYGANYIIKENTIELFGEFLGVSSSEWTFDFLLFLYKNNLNL